MYWYDPHVVRVHMEEG